MNTIFLDIIFKNYLNEFDIFFYKITNINNYKLCRKYYYINNINNIKIKNIVYYGIQYIKNLETIGYEIDKKIIENAKSLQQIFYFKNKYPEYFINKKLSLFGDVIFLNKIKNMEYFKPTYKILKYFTNELEIKNFITYSKILQKNIYQTKDICILKHKLIKYVKYFIDNDKFEILNIKHDIDSFFPTLKYHIYLYITQKLKSYNFDKYKCNNKNNTNNKIKYLKNIIFTYKNSYNNINTLLTFSIIEDDLYTFKNLIINNFIPYDMYSVLFTFLHSDNIHKYITSNLLQRQYIPKHVDFVPTSYNSNIIESYFYGKSYTHEIKLLELKNLKRYISYYEIFNIINPNFVRFLLLKKNEYIIKYFIDNNNIFKQAYFKYFKLDYFSYLYGYPNNFNIDMIDTTNIIINEIYYPTKSYSYTQNHINSLSNFSYKHIFIKIKNILDYVILKKLNINPNALSKFLDINCIKYLINKKYKFIDSDIMSLCDYKKYAEILLIINNSNIMNDNLLDRIIACNNKELLKILNKSNYKSNNSLDEILDNYSSIYDNENDPIIQKYKLDISYYIKPISNSLMNNFIIIDDNIIPTNKALYYNNNNNNINIINSYTDIINYNNKVSKNNNIDETDNNTNILKYELFENLLTIDLSIYNNIDELLIDIPTYLKNYNFNTIQ